VKLFKIIRFALWQYYYFGDMGNKDVAYEKESARMGIIKCFR
jgi:hypothetical protein